MGPELKFVWWWWTEQGLPRWVWRPYCWLHASPHFDDSYGTCAVCGKPLG